MTILGRLLGLARRLDDARYFIESFTPGPVSTMTYH